ncbi:MAG: succinylglutamate desuccinylase/aspartoacylase family protein [Thermoplasmata archaeon]|nr:succinylglutamate desuccinylase/aspartoacylase family protein [Thermoplasmata archaeon]
MLEEKVFIDEMYHNYFEIYRKPGGGHRVLIISGIHGDEHSSIYTNMLLKDHINDHMDYDITIIPIANMGAFLYRSRVSPYGGEDLNRIFPGKKNGSICERLADKIFSIAMDNDIIIDLHSCGFLCHPYILALYKHHKNIENLTKMIDLQYVIESRGTGGQLMTEVVKRGKNSIIIEMPSGFGGYIQKRVSENIFHVLLDFLENKKPENKKFYLSQMEKVRSEEFGLFFPENKILKNRLVKKDQRIGILNNKVIKSKRDGFLISVHFPSYVFKGEVLYEIAQVPS